MSLLLLYNQPGTSPGTAVYPDPEDVRVGVEYGPNGDDYTGTLEPGGDFPTVAQIADGILARNLAGGSDGGRTVRDALRAARNKVVFDAPSPGQFTVFAEDDTTTAWVGTYSRGSTALGPLTAVDPTG